MHAPNPKRKVDRHCSFWNGGGFATKQVHATSIGSWMKGPKRSEPRDTVQTLGQSLTHCFSFVPLAHRIPLDKRNICIVPCFFVQYSKLRRRDPTPTNPPNLLDFALFNPKCQQERTFFFFRPLFSLPLAVVIVRSNSV